MQTYRQVSNNLKRSFQVINPATLRVVGECPESGFSDIQKAIQEARGFQPQWAQWSLGERGQLLTKMASVMEDHQEELANLITAENGKLLGESRKEVSRAAESLKGLWKPFMTGLEVRTLDVGSHHQAFLNRAPLGVVGCFIPFNFPLHTLCQKIVQALIVGNTCVVKPSRATPLSAVRLFELLQPEIPRGLLSLITGSGQDFYKMSGIDAVSLTGSTEAGRLFVKESGLKPCTLELGGNDAALVLDDCDVSVAPYLARAAFNLNGQVCHALKRCYVHESLVEDLSSALVRECSGYQVGDPLNPKSTHGALTTADQYKRGMRLLDEVRDSAHILCGGPQKNATGYFFEAAVVVPKPGKLDTFKESNLVLQEQFCPILPLIPFSDPQEALGEINRDAMGLTGSCWSKDMEKGRELAKLIQAGTVYVNQHSSSHTSTSNPLYPSQGWKSSGFGSSRGMEGFLEYTQPQTWNFRHTWHT